MLPETVEKINIALESDNNIYIGSTENPSHINLSSDLAYIIYTSG